MASGHYSGLVMLACLALVGRPAAATPGKQVQPNAMSSLPKFPYDPSTTPYCTYWHDDDGEPWSCQDIYEYLWVAEADFLRWNPSVAPICASGGSLPFKRSFCVEARDEPKSTTATTVTTTTSQLSTTTMTITRATTTTTTTTKTTTVSTATTTTGNGIQTPEPIQPGMAANCNKFHLIKGGENCEVIAASEKVPVAKLSEWNSVGEGCSGLWANAYMCVGVVGYQPPTTTTTAGNGISTPQPIQSGMVSNCNKFYLVQPGNTCDVITRSQGISIDAFIMWNPQIGGKACNGMWANVYVCVGAIGYTPPSPTTTGNGIQTPSPTQPGLVNNCKKFYLVKPGDSCDSVSKANGISVDNFKKWNQGVGSGCNTMWANTYACVGV